MRRRYSALVRWLFTVVAVSITAWWGLSSSFTAMVCRQGSPMAYAWVEAGALNLMIAGPVYAHPVRYAVRVTQRAHLWESIGRADIEARAWRWLPWWSIDPNTEVSMCVIPVWPLVACSLLASGWCWARRRGARPGLCASCGYDRATLAPDAKCPECGATPAR